MSLESRKAVAYLRTSSAANVGADKDSDKRLEREVGFDPDLWIVEVEDRDGEARLDLAR